MLLITMKVQDNQNALYQEFISNLSQFNEFIDLAQQDEGIRKLMMQSHMYMIEPGNETEDEIAYAQNDGGGS